MTHAQHAQPIFSVIHASARPDKWWDVYNAWLSMAKWPDLVEYILVLDSKFFTFAEAMDIESTFKTRGGRNKMIWNNDHPDYVSNVNRGAKEATGMLFVVNADDQFPCDYWDEKLSSLPVVGINKHQPPNDFVIQVTTNTPKEHERGIMVMPILTKQRYERLGYVFYPAYESMYADNDLCEMAESEGCVVDGRELVFPHEHPLVKNGDKGWGDPDAVYLRQNRHEAYVLGERVFKQRQKNGFKDIKPELVKVDAVVRPVFSLCHATNRLPNGWKNVAAEWYAHADRPDLVEHVIAVNEPLEGLEEVFPNTQLGILNGTKKDCVAAWNLAAKLSNGKVIILIADDFFPPPHWDTELLARIDTDKPQVLEVSTGGHSGVITHPILTREYYSKYGYVLYPEFVSVFSDNDFTDQAKHDGVIINATDLVFEHRHPTIDKTVAIDEVYLNQGTDEAHRIGKSIYTERTTRRGLPIKKKIAICVPGEHFSSAWVDAWTWLLGYLIGRYDISVHFGYSSNVFVTRTGLAEGILSSHPAADYVLWIDDDNLLSVDQLKLLIDDLDSNPSVDIVAGWTWIQADVYDRPGYSSKTSVGTFDPTHGGCLYLSAASLASSPTDLIEIDWTGFPVVLMRYSALVKAGKRPFLPILTDAHAYGMSGEDVAFCKRAKDRGGCRITVDRRVKVPHLKLRSAEPLVLPSVALESVSVPVNS